MLPIRDHNPSERTPYVTYTLMAINIAIYLWGLAFITTDRQLGQLYFDFAMIPARITAGENYPSLITSIFLHAGFMHLAGNMLFLWIFGDNLEDKLGHIPFVIFYLVGGAGANLAQLMAGPMDPIPTIGASGAIAAVMGGYLLLFPKAKVDIFVFLIIFIRIIPVPAWIMLGLWFALQLLNGLGADTSEGGVAYWAHAGGFVVGFVLTLPFWLGFGGRDFWARTDGHPDHPEAQYRIGKTTIPTVRR